MPALIMYSGIIYGPVHSRRLGLSLGINLLPIGQKMCPFNCIYCECGTTTELLDETTEPKETRVTTFPTLAMVRQAVAEALHTYHNLNAITFSGHGEPSLHPQFPEIVETVKTLRDQYNPQAKVGVFSSSALIIRPRPRAGIDHCDLRMLKLDAGDEQTFHAIDRPSPNLHIADIIAELAHMENVIIQTCLVDGKAQNIRGKPWDALVRAIDVIRPLYVQFYSIDRPTAEAWVQQVSQEVLAARATELTEKTGIQTDSY